MPSSEGARTIPTISRVREDTIVELIHEPTERKTAFAVSRNGELTLQDRIEITDGEVLVPYAAQNNLIRHECVLLPSAPVEHGTKEVLLREIEHYLHRYVDFSSLFERIAAHYILLTWVFDAFNELPYLRFRGDYGSGKTRALVAVGSVAYRGFFASGASTVSPIFHTLDTFGGTLVLDEADLRHSDKTADLVKILNNGTVRGLPVLRSVQNHQKEFNPAAFTVFGPKVIAMRGTFKDQALESRFLTEEMSVRPIRSDISIGLPSTLKADALALRNKLLHFRLTNLFFVKTDKTRLIAGIDNRLNQTALSLLSLMDDVALRAELGALLRVKNGKLDDARGRSEEGRTYKVLVDAFQRPNCTSISLRDIAERINLERDELTSFVSPRRIGYLLRDHGIPLRKSHGNIVVPKTAAPMIDARAQQLGMGCRNGLDTR